MYRLSTQRAGFTRSGYWAPREYVNYRPDHYSPVITGDLFTALSEQQRQRSYADADFIITSDNEVSKARWRDYLTCAMNLLAPLTFVMPGLAPMLAVGVSPSSVWALTRSSTAEPRSNRPVACRPSPMACSTHCRWPRKR